MRARRKATTDKPRGTHQERSVERRAKIARAAVEILASHGVAGLTHRLIAERAGVSLAATTYYFATKFDIISEASGITLREYAESFGRAAERIRRADESADAFPQLVHRLIRNAAGRHRVRTLAWAEIVLDAYRHPENKELSRQWFDELRILWRDITKAAHVRQASSVARSAIDLVIGLLFMTLALGLDEPQVDAVLVESEDPLTRWKIADGSPTEHTCPPRLSPKSTGTRERILAATVDLLISDGVSAVTYRNIANKAGLSAAAPFYHFPTIDALLSAAEQRLFEESKVRYRAAAAMESHRQGSGREYLIDRTATIFLREATEFGGKNLAAYEIWLEAARNPRIRPMVWSAIGDQHRAWLRTLQRVAPTIRPLDALAAQASFIGKTIRVLATGSTTEDLAAVRSEFAFDHGDAMLGQFWL